MLLPHRFSQHCGQRSVSCSSSASASLTTTASQLQALLSWAESNKIQTDKLATSENLADGRPLLVAARDIQAGEAILTVPDSAWVGPAAAARSAIGPKVAGFEPWLQLTLLLMLERAGGGSKAGGAAAVPAAYLSALPAGAPDTPLFWDDGQLDMLRGTQLLQSLYAYRAYFQQTFADLEANLFASDRAAFPQEAFTYEAFLSAAATVRSRAHAPLDGAELALVPLADQLPHSRAANCAWKAKGTGLFGKGRALVVEAARAVRKGEELSLDYGPGKLDAAVLLDHGALDADWPQGGYSLSLSLPEGDRYRDDKLDLLERSGFGGPTATFSVKKGEDPSEEMLAFLRLSQLSGGDCFLLEAIFEAEAWSFMLQPVSGANEAAVVSSLAAGVRAALAAYPTAIEDDVALLRGASGASASASASASGAVALGPREVAAVRARLGEKEALDGLLAWLEEREASLPRLEYYQERRLKRLGLMDDNGDTTYDGFFRDGIA